MSFDVLAPHYRWMELVSAGEMLQRCRTAFLGRVPAPNNILILGEGNGRFLLECRRRFPNSEITVVDASARMIELARKRLARQGVTAHRDVCKPIDLTGARSIAPRETAANRAERCSALRRQPHSSEVRGPINFIRADALTWTPPAQAFDLIVTHFFLDCFRADQLEILIPKLARAAAPESNWLLADFQAAPAGWRRHRSRAILWLMYRFFIAAAQLPARTLTAPDELLERSGFNLRDREVYDWELLHSDWWQLRR